MADPSAVEVAKMACIDLHDFLHRLDSEQQATLAKLSQALRDKEAAEAQLARYADIFGEIPDDPDACAALKAITAAVKSGQVPPEVMAGLIATGNAVLAEQERALKAGGANAASKGGFSAESMALLANQGRDGLEAAERARKSGKKIQANKAFGNAAVTFGPGGAGMATINEAVEALEAERESRAKLQLEFEATKQKLSKLKGQVAVMIKAENEKKVNHFTEIATNVDTINEDISQIKG